MSELQTLILGFVAGVTIVLGLPVGRLRSPHRRADYRQIERQLLYDNAKTVFRL